MRNNWINRLVVTCGLALSLTSGVSQRLITASEVVDLALKNSGAFQSSELQVRQNRYLQKTGFSLPNPEVIAESPTGEFYAVGVLQSMEFPSVYLKQNQLKKQITKLSEKQKEVTRLDIVNLVRSLYLNVQLAEALYAHLQVQDSLYHAIARSADRQFEAGTIDFLAKTFAHTQAGEVHNQLLQTREEYNTVINQLKLYTGLSDSVKTNPLARMNEENNVRVDSLSIFSNPSIQYYEQLKNVNRRTLGLERNKALPGLVFGYLNQGAKTTDTYYRFRVGFTVPLWFWQYSGNIKAAKTGVEIAEQDSKAQQQTVTSEMIQAQADMTKFRQSLEYYESRGLKQTEDIITTARRFFESGQLDYIGYLRNINEAYLIKARYLETLKNYNQSIITINYLTGKL